MENKIEKNIFNRLYNSYTYQKNDEYHNKWIDYLLLNQSTPSNEVFSNLKNYSKVLTKFGNNDISNGLNCAGQHKFSKMQNYNEFLVDLKEFILNNTKLSQDCFYLENKFQLFGEKIKDNIIIPTMFYKMGLHLKLINNIFNDDNYKKTILEIGAGWGGLPYLIKKNIPNVTYLIVDIPNTINISAYFLHENNNKIRLPDESLLKNITFQDYDVIFITPKEISDIPNNTENLNYKKMKTLFNENLKEFSLIENLFCLKFPYKKLNYKFFCNTIAMSNAYKEVLYKK